MLYPTTPTQTQGQNNFDWEALQRRVSKLPSHYIALLIEVAFNPSPHRLADDEGAFRTGLQGKPPISVRYTHGQFGVVESQGVNVLAPFFWN